MNADGSIEMIATPTGVAIISQTCDVVRSTPSTILVAPIGCDGKIAREASLGRRPRHVAIPALGNDRYVDLDVVATVPKDVLNGLRPRHGVEGDRQARDFSRAVGRRFSRFAFPDRFVPQIDPLVRKLRSKSRSAGSEGNLLNKHVRELRVEAYPGWSKPPYSVTLAVLVHPTILPSYGDDPPPPMPAPLRAWLDEARRSPADLADHLLDDGLDDASLYHLWQRLGEEWLALCRRVDDPVADISIEIVAVDEYTYDRVLVSEQLDLDHLSPPIPE